MSNMPKATAQSTGLIGPPGPGDTNGMRSKKINHDDDEEALKFLTNGAVFTKWEEEPLSLQDCTVYVDSKGFFFCYTSDLEKETVYIDLAQVSDVRVCVPKEKVREMWESVSQEPLNERSFAIVFGSNMVDVNFLRLVSPTTQAAKEWINALNTLIRMKKFKNPSVALLLEKQYVKSRCMKNLNGKIPIKNICKCLTNSIRYEQRFYDGMQTLQLPHEKNDEIDPDEFTLHHFYKLYTFLCPRQDLDELFMKKCGGRAPFMKLQQVVDFINGEQRDPRLNEILFPYCSREKASDLIRKYEPSPELSQTDRMSFDGLARFLMSEDNLILKKDHLWIKHDLNQPLTHYFIHSSHNTYLIGRQFGGKSSVEMYRQCLLAGCRCIELDCWDGLGDEPIITHGKALCTNILFKDVIVAIKESAFVTSPLPIILSFENHCSRLQQRKLAEYCIDIFGDMLLHQPLDSHPLEEGTFLPPPNQLLYKILIKNKKLNPELENDLLMSESFDNLCEKQLQPTDDNGLEQRDESDSQTTNSTDNNTGHLALRPMLTPKRLSVITEGAMGAGNNQEEVVEADTDNRVGIDNAGAALVAEDTIMEEATTADTLVKEEVHANSDNQEAASVDTLSQVEDSVDAGNQKAASVDTVVTKASTLDILITRTATANSINEKRASTQTPDQISTTEKVVSVDTFDKKSETEDTVDRKAATVDTTSKGADAVDTVNKNAATVDLEEGKTSTFNCFQGESNTKDPVLNGATVADKEGKLLSTERTQNNVVHTVSVRAIDSGAEARMVEKAPTVEKLLQEAAVVGRHQEQIASIDILDNLVFGLREERAKERVSDEHSPRLKLDSSSFNYDDEVAEATKTDASREKDGARCRISCCSDSSAMKDYLTNSDTVSIKTNASNPEEVFEKDGPRIRSNSGDSNSKTVIISSGKSKPMYEVSICRSDSLSKMKNSISSMDDIDDDIVSSPDRSRTESVQSDISEASIDEEAKSLTSNENVTTKQYKILSPLLFNGSASKKFVDSLRRIKSPVNKQYSLNEKSTKLTVRGKSLSADLQEAKRQRVLRSASPEEFVDSDEEVRRSNHPRSSSVASTSTLGSAAIKFGKKSYRGGSFTSDDDEMGSQQLSTHKNVDPLLSSLVNYVQPSVFQSFEFAEEQNVSHKMSSFNESSAIQLVKTGPVEFTKYNKRQFSRIYPKGTRVDSTNYNPQAFWNVGCQLVSLNLQTPDVPFQLNQAKFEANSQLGYLLKPEIMRRSVDKAFDPFTESPLDGIIPATVVVKVISGQFLTEKKCHTYVMVELYGLPADTKRKNKTKLAHSNFMNTLFSDECFVFTKVILPELALMRFVVYDENDKVLGQVVLPLEGIQPGYRHIPLRTEAGLQCPLSTLFVHISLKTYVPEKYADFADRLFEPMKYETQIEKRSEQIRVFDITDADEESFSPLLSGLANGPRPSVSSLFSINSSVHSMSTSSPFAVRKFMPSESGLDSIMKVEEYVKKEEPVTFEDFKHDKQYLKLLKKHQKDLEVLEKKHEKERANMQKMKQTQREKIKSAFDKSKMSEEKMLEKISKRSNSDVSNELLTKFEQKIKYLEKHMHEKLVENASKMNQEDAEMTAKHIHERVGLRLYHVAEQFENLKSLLYQSQSHEEKLLKEKFEREMTELTKKQAKQSIDDAKSLSADKSIKSKEERERLQRERDRQNVEIFISGRQELKVEQDKEMQALRQKHKDDIERMETEQNRIMESEKNIFRKVTVAKQQILQSGLIASTS